MIDLTKYLEQLTNTQSVEDLWDMHTTEMARYDFDRVIYGFTRYRSTSGLGDPQDMVILSNQTPEYMEKFIGDGLYFHAPMVRWALENNGACSWAWMGQQHNLSKTELRIVEFNKRMKVTAGYTISFRSVSVRSKGAIALTAREGMSQDEIDDVWAEHGRQIMVMNNVAHLKLHTLPYTGGRHLTKRQVEVLEWVGDGKTTQDIAILLELTSATIEKHLRLAREALDVETTAQAVLKAAVYNQMFILDA